MREGQGCGERWRGERCGVVGEGVIRRQHGCGPHLLVLEDLKLVGLAYKSRKMPFQIEPEALRAELQPLRDRDYIHARSRRRKP